MERKHAIVLTLTFVLVGLMFFSVDTPLVTQQDVETTIHEAPEIVEHIAEGPVSEEPLRLNVIPNPSFEDWDFVNHYPEKWYALASAYQHGDTAYTEEVANGVYSGYVEGMGGDVAYANSYIYTRPQFPVTDALIEPGISLSFNWNALAMPDLQIGSDAYLYIITRDGLGNDYYLFYYLSSGDATYTNFSTYARFMINETTNQWNNFDRNITEDFMAVFGAGALTSAHYIDYLWFYVSSPSGATGIARAAFDDVVLYNSTYTDWIQNGNFESGTGSQWSTYNSASGFVSQSTDSSLGTYSVNITVPQLTQGSGYARCYRSFSTTGTYHAIYPGMNIIEVDWKYNDSISAGIGQYAYVRFAYYNGSMTYYVHYYFGHGLDTVTSSNSTTNFYVKIPGFGARDTWTHSTFDLYEANSQLGLYNLSLIGISMYAYDAMVSGSVELLVDDFRMITYPASDPSFEYDNVASYNPPFLGWHRAYNVPGTVTGTTDSHSGQAACNITTVGQEEAIYRGDIYVDFDSKLETDFWWRLDHMDSSSSAGAYIQIEFFNSASYWYIRYLLGKSTTWMPSNSSNYKYVQADGFNQTGIWFNFVRNLTADFENSFAVSSDTWYLSGIQLHVFSATSMKVSCLFDDINFKDAEPPVISDVDQSVDPVYYEVTSVSVTATDTRPGVSSVVVNYTTDGWSSSNIIDATYSISTYDADIPAQPYDTLVQYYVIATDGCGVQAIDDNGGGYYSYTVGDDIDPLLDSPADIEFTVGTTGHTIDWDPTDIRPLTYEVFVDSVSIVTGDWNASSEHIVIDLDGLAVGEYNYTCVVYDEAGNSAVDTVIVTVNEGETTGGGDLMTPLLIVAVVGVVAILLIVFVVLPKMKKT